MAVTLRLMRIGKRNRPFYRVIAIEKREKRNGEYIDNLGTYDPLTTPAQIQIDQKKLDRWIEKGAMISEGLRRLLKYSRRTKKD